MPMSCSNTCCVSPPQACCLHRRPLGPLPDGQLIHTETNANQTELECAVPGIKYCSGQFSLLSVNHSLLYL